MRVYVPSTLPLLRVVADEGAIGPAPVMAFAVTPRFREWYASGDPEELEYAAMAETARASLRLVARDPQAARRRVVIAADVADAAASPAEDISRAAVLVGTIALTDVASIHVDTADADAVIVAAAAAIDAADTGDDDARFVVDEADDYELAWYATQEIPDLIG